MSTAFLPKGSSTGCLGNIIICGVAGLKGRGGEGNTWWRFLSFATMTLWSCLNLTQNKQPKGCGRADRVLSVFLSLFWPNHLPAKLLVLVLWNPACAMNSVFHLLSALLFLARGLADTRHVLLLLGMNEISYGQYIITYFYCNLNRPTTWISAILQNAHQNISDYKMEKVAWFRISNHSPNAITLQKAL